jgi:putative transposase
MKRFPVRLTPEEHAELDRFVHTGIRSVQAVVRARLLLMANEQGAAQNDVEIARTLSISVKTVQENRKRYAQDGLQAVLNRRPRKDKGIPVKVDGRVEAQLTRLACSQTPNDEPSWTLSMLGDQLVQLGVVDSISRETVRKTLKKIASSRT